MDLEKPTQYYFTSTYPVQEFITLAHYDVADNSRHERHIRQRMRTPRAPK